MSNNVFTAKNTFGAGLIQDMAPDNTQATCMTNALNATLKTNNGNELSLQNDMGNTKVETAELPEGYVPVGTCEFGGIVYIASVNPETNKSLIGCFPSPERNIENSENKQNETTITINDFITKDNDVRSTIIKQLTDYKLYPGDEIKVTLYSDEKSLLESYELGVLDSSNKFVELNNLETNILETNDSEIKGIYNSPYVSNLYIRAYIKGNNLDFELDYLTPTIENDTLTINITSNYDCLKVNETLINKTDGVFKVKKDDVNKDAIVSFKVIPVIKINNNSYYYLSEQEKIINIDTSKLGSNTAEINIWKYYHYDSHLLLYFQINAFPSDEYLELGNIKLEFKEIYPENSESTSFTMTLPQEYYNTHQYLTIEYDNYYDNVTHLGKLNKNKLYLVNITLDKLTLSENSSYKVFTCPVFNGIWDNQVYTKENNEEILENIDDYTSITSNHYYKEGGKEIYPLRITISPEVIQQDIKTDIYDDKKEESISWVKESLEEEIIVTEKHYTLESLYDISYKIDSTFGDKFFKDINVTYTVNDIDSPSTIKITNNFKETYTINLTYQESNNPVKINIFKPFIYNENDFANYKIDADTFNFNINEFPSIWIFAKEDPYNLMRSMCKCTFEDNWLKPKKVESILDPTNHTKGVDLDFRDILDVLNLLKLINNGLLCPVVIGTIANHDHSIFIPFDSKINSEFLGPLQRINGIVSKKESASELTATSISSLDSDNFYSVLIPGKDSLCRIWWWFMQDENGNYLPLNWFGYHRPYDFLDSDKEKAKQCICGPNSTIIPFASDYVALLATIYKYDSSEDRLNYYTINNYTIETNNNIKEIKFRITLGITDNFENLGSVTICKTLSLLQNKNIHDNYYNNIVLYINDSRTSSYGTEILFGIWNKNNGNETKLFIGKYVNTKNLYYYNGSIIKLLDKYYPYRTIEILNGNYTINGLMSESLVTVTNTDWKIQASYDNEVLEMLEVKFLENSIYEYKENILTIENTFSDVAGNVSILIKGLKLKGDNTITILLISDNNNFTINHDEIKDGLYTSQHINGLDGNLTLKIQVEVKSGNEYLMFTMEKFVLSYILNKKSTLGIGEYLTCNDLGFLCLKEENKPFDLGEVDYIRFNTNLNLSPYTSL